MDGGWLFILRVGKNDLLGSSRIRENSGGQLVQIRILTNSATTHTVTLQLNVSRFGERQGKSGKE